MAITIDLLQQAQDDRAQRVELGSAPEFIQWSGPVTELLPPGSGAFIYASASSELFQRLSESLRQGNAGGVDESIETLKQEIAQLQQVSDADALHQLIAAPSYADLTYRGKTLTAATFTVGSVSLTRVLFPYAGGTVDPSQFEVTEYIKQSNFHGSERATAMSSAIVLHEPELSSIERSVIDAIPVESDQVKMGDSSDGPLGFWPLAAAFVATVTVGITVAAVGTALGHCNDIFTEIARVDPPDDLSSNPLIGVRQLVDLRKRAIQTR